MGDTWFMFLPVAVFLGVLIGQSYQPRTCPHCGKALIPAHPAWLAAAPRWGWRGDALAAAIGLILILALAVYRTGPAPLVEAAPPPLVLPKVEAVPPPIAQPKGPPA